MRRIKRYRVNLQRCITERYHDSPTVCKSQIASFADVGEVDVRFLRGKESVCSAQKTETKLSF